MAEKKKKKDETVSDTEVSETVEETPAPEPEVAAEPEAVAPAAAEERA